MSGYRFDTNFEPITGKDAIAAVSGLKFDAALIAFENAVAVLAKESKILDAIPDSIEKMNRPITCAINIVSILKRSDELHVIRTMKDTYSVPGKIPSDKVNEWVEHFRAYAFDKAQEMKMSTPYDVKMGQRLLSIDAATRVFEKRITSGFHSDLTFSATYHQWLDGGFCSDKAMTDLMDPREHMVLRDYILAINTEVEIAGTSHDESYQRYVDMICEWTDGRPDPEPESEKVPPFSRGSFRHDMSIADQMNSGVTDGD